MAKVYIETIPSNLYSITTWSDSGTTTYAPGDRVSLSDSVFVGGGGAIDNSHNRIYVCVNGNNSTTYPFDDSSNWVLAGSSEEYPCYAVDGSICNSAGNEVYLEYEAGRYAGIGSHRFTWNQATAQGTEHGELIFADGEYNDNQKGFTIDKLSFTAKNKGKVSVSTTGYYQYIFQGNEASTQLEKNALEVSMMTGIKFLISGTKYFHGSNQVFGFDSCVITDQGEGTAYTPATFRVGNVNSHLNVKNTVFNLPNTSLTLVGYQSATHRGSLSQFKNSTFYMGATSAQYTPLTLNTSTGLEISECIFAFITSGYTGSNSFRLGAPHPSKNNLIYCYDSSVPPPAPDDGTTYGVCIVADPLFVDRESGDFRLRPSSPLIGGIESKDKRSKIENQYPQGKWFDSGAADDGDGAWDTPYNNYGEAINSFTGEEAVILIKEGQHTLFSGSPDSSGSFSPGNDLLKAYSNGIKFIGMGPESVFDSSSSGIIAFGAFGSQSSNSNPNCRNTPFLFKDFDILLNNSGSINRGMICARRAEYINVNVTQSPNLGAISSQLFDYSTSSGSNDSGEYLKMTGCTINVSMSSNTSGTSSLVGSSGGLKQFTSCTFVDLNRTTSLVGGSSSPSSFLQTSFGSYPGSYIKDCIIYSKNNITNQFGSNYSSSNLEVKNVVVYSTAASVSVSNKWADGVTITDPRFIATEPHDNDLRLRPDSPLIGGITQSKYPADAIWMQTGSGTGSGTEDDPFYWDEYSAAFLAAAQSSSNQLVFKDGTYIWTSAILQDDNVGNNITMVAENMHQAIFTDSGRINSAGKDPTLRFKNIKLLAKDHFTHVPVCHYVFDSIHLLCNRQVGALSVTATGSIFEVATGQNTSIFNNSGPVNIRNCIFTDHNDRAPSQSFLTHANSGIIKNTIFYAKYPRADCIMPGHGAVLISCASENITNQRSGIEYFNNLDFIDIDNKNYGLRPSSPLIGKGL